MIFRKCYKKGYRLRHICNKEQKSKHIYEALLKETKGAVLQTARAGTEPVLSVEVEVFIVLN